MDCSWNVPLQGIASLLQIIDYNLLLFVFMVLWEKKSLCHMQPIFVIVNVTQVSLHNPQSISCLML